MTAEVPRFTKGAQIKLRLKAALVHAGISLLVFIPLAYLVLFRWYPSVYFESDGGWHGMFIIFCVDVVLGPTLTFIIFTPGKTRAKIYFDLGCIALIQIGALIWGIYAVHSQRPVAIVLWENSFHPVISATYEVQGVSVEQLDAFDTSRPVTLLAKPPTTKAEMASAFLETLNGEIAMFHVVERYVRLGEDLLALEKANVGWNRLQQAEPKLQPKLLHIAAGAQPESVFLVPFRGRYADAILMLSAEGEYLGGVVPTGSY